MIRPESRKVSARLFWKDAGELCGLQLGGKEDVSLMKTQDVSKQTKLFWLGKMSLGVRGS